jgi:hypothetical protein
MTGPDISAFSTSYTFQSKLNYHTFLPSLGNFTQTRPMTSLQFPEIPTLIWMGVLYCTVLTLLGRYTSPRAHIPLLAPLSNTPTELNVAASTVKRTVV